MLNLQLDSNFYHSPPTKTFPKNTACKFWDKRKCSWRSCHIFPTTVQIKGHLDKSKLVRTFLWVNPALSKEFLHQSPTSVIVVHSRQWWCTLQWAKPTRAKRRSTLQRGESTIGFGSLEKEMIMRTTQIKGFVLNKKMNFFFQQQCHVFPSPVSFINPCFSLSLQEKWAPISGPIKEELDSSTVKHQKQWLAHLE